MNLCVRLSGLVHLNSNIDRAIYMWVKPGKSPTLWATPDGNQFMTTAPARYMRCNNHANGIGIRAKFIEQRSGGRDIEIRVCWWCSTSRGGGGLLCNSVGSKQSPLVVRRSRDCLTRSATWCPPPVARESRSSTRRPRCEVLCPSPANRWPGQRTIQSSAWQRSPSDHRMRDMQSIATVDRQSVRPSVVDSASRIVFIRVSSTSVGLISFIRPRLMQNRSDMRATWKRARQDAL